MNNLEKAKKLEDCYNLNVELYLKIDCKEYKLFIRKTKELLRKIKKEESQLKKDWEELSIDGKIAIKDRLTDCLEAIKICEKILE